MKQTDWTLEQLKSHLALRSEIKSWIISEVHVQRRERYFMQEDGSLIIDQDRSIGSRNVSLKLLVRLNRSDQKRQGEITKKLSPSLPLQSQIDDAIEAALQTDHQAWDLPEEIPSEIPHFSTTDPKMAEDLNGVMEKLTHRISKAVQKKRTTHFNSAELFLSTHHRGLHLSNGLIHRSSQSRIYTETAFSFARQLPNQPLQSDEYLSTHWAVHQDDLPIEELFDETSSRAEHSLDVVKPQSGKYSVIVDSEVLSHLLNGQLSQFSALHSYNGLPFIKAGKEFIHNPKGDLLTITLDPTLDYGADTCALSEHGLLQATLKIVDRNQVIATLTDKQYGDYLGLAPTTIRGSIVIDPGTLSYEELTQQSPKVIEILQFSGLFSDPNTGTFGSEIRLARLFDHEKGRVTYLKGGSLSGSIFENFQNLRLSKTRVNRAHFSGDGAFGQGYFGPQFALLSDVSIVG